MKKFALLFLMVFCTAAFGQKMKLVSGNLDFLKDVKEINVDFDYSNMTFFKEKMTEKQYIEKRKKEISEGKNEGEFSKWLADWERTKRVQMPDKFLASWNKYGDIKGGQNLKTKYTLIVETTWVYPGWFAGVMNQPSKVSTLLKFVESANRRNELAVVQCENAPGDNFVGLPNNNDRIAEAYAKTSKELAQFIKKKLK